MDVQFNVKEKNGNKKGVQRSRTERVSPKYIVYLIYRASIYVCYLRGRTSFRHWINSEQYIAAVALCYWAGNIESPPRAKAPTTSFIKLNNRKLPRINLCRIPSSIHPRKISRENLIPRVSIQFRSRALGFSSCNARWHMTFVNLFFLIIIG